MKKLDLLTNKTFCQDFMIGAIYGFLFIPFIGLWGILTVLTCGLCWALGGQYGHSIRVFGVPAGPYLCILGLYNHLGAIMSYIMSAVVLSMGYGQPTRNPLWLGPIDDYDFNNPMKYTDAGSWLGQICYRLSKGNLKLSNFLTRGTIYLLLISSAIFSIL